MANTKISALTAATTPVAGTEVLPIVQSSATKQLSIANLTVGRAVTVGSLVSAGAGSFVSDVTGGTGRTISGGTGGYVLSADGINTDFVSTGRAAAITGSFGTVRVHQTASYRGLAIIGDTSQTASYFEIESSTGGAVLSINSSGSLLTTSAIGFGYGTGSGGTVTQATNKSTAVTLNKPTGQITMNNAALLGLTAVVFRLNDSLISSVDTVIYAASGNGNYEITTHAIFAGAVDIRVTNATAGSLSEALVINFSIIKGATA